MGARDQWFADSPVGESGFEPLVPLTNDAGERYGAARLALLQSNSVAGDAEQSAR